jgi:acyl carrier protein
MERAEIISHLNKIFEDVIDEGPVFLTDATTANDVAGWDSLTNIQLIIAIEKGFNIRFASEEILSWKNVGEVVDCILKK